MTVVWSIKIDEHAQRTTVKLRRPWWLGGGVICQSETQYGGDIEQTYESLLADVPKIKETVLDKYRKRAVSWTEQA